MSEHLDFNSQIIEEFRANGGRVGGPFEGATLLLLHHTGAKTAVERVTPLVYQRVGDGFAVFGSKGGAPVNPAWYHNLLAHPDVTIEVGTRSRKVTARVAVDAERGEIWTRQKQLMPGFASYERDAAPREIPVVILEPAG